VAGGRTCQQRSRWQVANRGVNASAALRVVASEFPTCGAITLCGDEVLSTGKCVGVEPESELMANPLLSLATGRRYTKAVERAVVRPSTCVPDGNILTSVVTSGHAKLRELQFAAVRDLTCLLSRAVTLSFGEAASADAFGDLVAAPHVPTSSFNQGFYHELIWVKWAVLHLALQAEGVSSVLFLDADVVF